MPQRKYWFSAKHLVHLRHCGRTDTTVVIDGKPVIYTAACIADAIEPFEGALEHFPDYQCLGEGDDLTVRFFFTATISDTAWIQTPRQFIESDKNPKTALSLAMAKFDKHLANLTKQRKSIGEIL